MNLDKIFAEREQLYLKIPPHILGVFWGGAIVGLLVFVGGMLTGEYIRTWGSFLFNLMFFFSLGLGGVAFGQMQDLIGAKWGRPIKRIHESFGFFVPVAAVGILFFLLSIKLQFLHAHEVYAWIKDPSILKYFHGKDIWLQENFMLARDVFCILLITILVYWQQRKTLQPDQAFMAGNREEAQRLGESNRKSMRHWAAPIMVVHSCAFTVLCFDLTMSLAPTWFSTLWGGWSFALMMHSLMACILLTLFALKGSYVGQHVKRAQFHDIGKIMHGFTAFFAYLTYAHILTYWYINMPEETSYFHTRLKSPWVTYMIVVFFTVFVIPLFGLIPKAAKWTPKYTIPLAVLIFASHWVNYMLVVMPELTDGKSFPWIELGCFLGFGGLFLGTVFTMAGRVPMLSVGDPLLPQAYVHH